MAKFKIQILCSVLALALSACADGGFNPVVGAGYNTGLYNNGFNNGLNNGLNNWNNGVFNNGFSANGMPCNWNQSSMQACNPFTNMSYSTYYNPYLMYNPYAMSNYQPALDWRAQLMFNPSFRMNSLYYPVSDYSNVYVNQYPTYTPTRCACYTAPCDCDGVISRVYQSDRSSRRINRINRRIERRNARIERRIERLNSRLSPTYHADDCYPSSSHSCTVVTHHHHTTTTTTSSSGSSSGDAANSGSSSNSSSTGAQPAAASKLSFSLKTEDSEQLYIRLARKEERHTVGGKENAYPITKTGTHYYCVKSDDKNNPFFCQIEIDLDEGKVLQQHSASSGPGTADLQISNITTDYVGPALAIKRENPETAVLVLRDSRIESAFKKLNGGSKDKNADANIVDLDDLQIRKVQDGTNWIYEIELRAKTETGEMIPRALW